jgi:hypothetical protein
MGKDVLALTDEHYLRPQSRAALFEAATKVPGLKVVEHAVDGAGRSASRGRFPRDRWLPPH